MFLRKADKYEKVRRTCLECADNQKVFVSQEKQVTDQARSGHQESEKEKLQKETSEKVDTLCKKFEQLTLLISKDKPKKNIQYITCHKCKKPGHYANQCQLIGITPKDVVIVADTGIQRPHVTRSRQTRQDPKQIKTRLMMISERPY